MEKIKIPMFDCDNTDNISIHEVDALPIIIKGYEDFKFFTHKSIYQGVDHKWKVTELSSGHAIGGGFTKKQAIDKAKQNLASISIQALRDRISTAISLVKSKTK